MRFPTPRPFFVPDFFVFEMLQARWTDIDGMLLLGGERVRHAVARGGRLAEARGGSGDRHRRRDRDRAADAGDRGGGRAGLWRAINPGVNYSAIRRGEPALRCSITSP